MSEKKDDRVEKTQYSLLTVHGEFLRGGGKRGLLSNAELRWPLDWPPSTLNVAPLSHIKEKSSIRNESYYRETKKIQDTKLNKKSVEVLKHDCNQSEVLVYLIISQFAPL